MALEPTAMIEGLANGYAVEPSFQRTAVAEVSYPLEGLEKHFLRAVGRIGWVAQHAQDQIEHRGMVVGDEPVESGFRAGLELVDQFGFVTAPREGAGPIGHAVPFWRGVPLTLGFKYKP